jgi:hypothetical protein
MSKLACKNVINPASATLHAKTHAIRNSVASFKETQVAGIAVHKPIQISQ